MNENGKQVTSIRVEIRTADGGVVTAEATSGTTSFDVESLSKILERVQEQLNRMSPRPPAPPAQKGQSS